MRNSSPAPGQVVILNGAPRAGKSSIARVIQETFEGPWMVLGVDAHIAATPPSLRPGIGLRPGGERPDLEAHVAALYLALYDSIAAHSRQGLNVVADLGHHDAYSQPLNILPQCARRLTGLPAFLVGVRCELETILRRRAEGEYLSGPADDPRTAPVRLWQAEVHRPGLYDLEVDTTSTSSEACAAAIRRRLDRPSPTAFVQLAAMIP